MPGLRQRLTAIGVRGYLLAEPGWRERWELLLGFALLIVLRLPGVMVHGRVWAEEGTIFMHNAEVLPWTQALFWPVGGYLNIAANFAGIIAADMVPLELVRWVGPVFGLVFQMMPAILILSSNFSWLQSRIGLVVALLLIATVPLGEEVWLNSLHPQFHLTLCAALIMAMDPANGWKAGFHLWLVALGALCGPTAWFLLPLFAVRAGIDRSRRRLMQAVLLAICVLLQFLLFYSPAQTNGGPVAVGSVVSALFIKHVLIVGLDYRTARVFITALQEMAVAKTVPVAIAVAEFAAIGLVGRDLWSRGRSAWFWMFAAALFIAIPSYAAARGGTIEMLHIMNGNRYAFVPHLLFALVLLGIAVTGSGVASVAARIGIAWILAVGILEFHDDSIRPYFSQGPFWTDEVAAWRRDHTHVLRIWPNGWLLDLNADTAAH
jgi:hypothetical protein